jgi:PAS domain S-box-containing protein
MPDASSENHPLAFTPACRLLAEQLLVEVLSQLGEGVATVTADGTILCWNPRLTNLTGYSANAANARGWTQLFELSPRLLQMVEQARAGLPTVGEHLTLKCADGSQQPVQLWCLPLPHTDSAEARVLVVCRDVTTATPQPTAVGATERIRLLAQLAGAVSHEIYNPLNAVLLHADILEEELGQPDGANREQLLHSLEVMKTRVTQLYDMIQEYLVLARLGDLSRVAEDVGALLDTLAREMHERLRAYGITLTLQGMAGLGQVPLHRPTFWCAMCNVVQYALEAMPHGGMLTLHGQRFEAHVRLDMHHTGSGPAAEQLAV